MKVELIQEWVRSFGVTNFELVEVVASQHIGDVLPEGFVSAHHVIVGTEGPMVATVFQDTDDEDGAFPDWYVHTPEEALSFAKALETTAQRAIEARRRAEIQARVQNETAGEVPE